MLTLMGYRAAAAVLALIVALSSIAHAQTDLLRALGLTTDDAHEGIFNSVANGAIALIGKADAFRNASAEQRALLARAAIALARAYTGTADFARRYAEFREGQRPERDQVAQTGDEAAADQQKEMENAIREAQQAAASLPPDLRKQMEAQIAEMKKQFAAQAADPEMKKARDAAVPEMARQADADYKERLAQFEKDYPADAKQLIARRLRAFLDVSATVDFSAKLVEKDKKMRFADPALEAKPSEWKLLYRAGKPAVDAARAAAQEWLKALGG